MSRISLSSIILGGFLIGFFSLAIFPQSNNLQNDLSDSFKKFDLVSYDSVLFEDSARKSEAISIQAAGKTFVLYLRPRDLRAPNYRAAESNAVGNFPVEMEKIYTFQGRIAGEQKSQVRLTIDGEKIEGYFTNGIYKFFIEPARKYSNLAGVNDFVIYQAGDLLNETALSLDRDIADKIERGNKMIGTRSFDNLQTFYVLEIATEADFAFVNNVGGSVQANREILTSLNLVEGVYESELDITFSVVFQHTWTTQDPFPATSTQATIDVLIEYWNTNFPLSQIHRDVTHLWTGKPNFAGQGLSALGVICDFPEVSYGLHGRVTNTPGEQILIAHEIGHNFNASHAGAAQNCSGTIMNAFISSGAAFSFCPFSRGEINAFVSSNNSCLARRNLTPLFDFDGDNRADISVWRPTGGVWYINKSSGGFNIIQFGQNGDRPVPGDFDGDEKTDIAIYRSGIWYLLNSSNNSFDVINFGLASDIPAPADFDGDGKSELAVFRPSNGVWYVLNKITGASGATQFGASGDVPIAADYDGDGRADINVFRPSNGVWYRINSSNSSTIIRQFGTNGDKPVIADFDGDGKTDLAVWRPSNGVWYGLSSIDGSFSSTAFGVSTDIPVAADYDGDGKTDKAVFRPSNGVWYLLNSRNGESSIVPFGSSSDIPVPSFYVR